MANSIHPPRYAASGDYGVDTTETKIFVGGLAWETRRDTMKRYFEQFGEILEAVVITDKHNGRSKGYGFVIFKDPEAARRACSNPSPVIDGRRANCNLASQGHNRDAIPPPILYRPIRPVFPPTTSAYNRIPTSLNSWTNYTLWYPGLYPNDSTYPYVFYNFPGGNLQPYSYYPGSGTSTPTMIPYYNLFYGSQFLQPNQGGGGTGGSGGYGLHYGPVLPLHYYGQYPAGLVPLAPNILAPQGSGGQAIGSSGLLQPQMGADRQSNSA